MDDLTLVEKWLAGIITVGGIMVAWANKEAKQSSISERLTARVESAEKDIKVLKEAYDQRLNEIQSDLHSLRVDMKNEVKALWDRSEERHNRLDGKLDRLLERSSGK